MYNCLIMLVFFLNNNALCSSAFLNFSNEHDLSFKNDNYFIKSHYICRNAYFADNHANNGIDEAQGEVYQEAYNIALECDAKIIGDIGCGSAYKLLKYFSSYKTIGFEIEPNFNYLISQYPKKTWLYGDFDRSVELPFFNVIICADVIEHLLDPDQILNWIQSLNFDYLVISTPDRDKLPLYQKPSTQSQKGPPVNPHHIREWSFAEFETYISQFFKIKKHSHNKVEWMAQVIIATKK